MKFFVHAASVAIVAVCATVLVDRSARGQSTSGQYVGEMRTFASNFCPTGWLSANGGLVVISQFGPLYGLIGTTYGGDGKTNFGLPHPKAVPMESGGTLTHCISYQGTFPTHP